MTALMKSSLPDLTTWKVQEIYAQTRGVRVILGNSCPSDSKSAVTRSRRTYLGSSITKIQIPYKRISFKTVYNTSGIFLHHITKTRRWVDLHCWARHSGLIRLDILDSTFWIRTHCARFSWLRRGCGGKQQCPTEPPTFQDPRPTRQCQLKKSTTDIK